MGEEVVVVDEPAGPLPEPDHLNNQNSLSACQSHQPFV